VRRDLGSAPNALLSSKADVVAGFLPSGTIMSRSDVPRVDPSKPQAAPPTRAYVESFIIYCGGIRNRCNESHLRVRS
jgi:hypothetical protein